jgi:cytochrome bd-type quinol oxidase subunit 2
METLWFVLVATMLTGYVVLDGFDLGVGALYRVVARTPEERAAVRQSIGPVWDANEVWLVAGAGTLYFAFPALYASAFSGFYLPLMLVLWMLIGRALGLELGGHMHEPLGRQLCETIFVVSSVLLTFVLGVAFGNVIRGVPLDGSSAACPSTAMATSSCLCGPTSGQGRIPGCSTGTPCCAGWWRRSRWARTAPTTSMAGWGGRCRCARRRWLASGLISCPC